MNRARSMVVVGAAVACVWCAVALGDVVIEIIPVGNPGNPGDTRYPSGGVSSFGSVGYTYNIGKYEVTAGQYCEFLNAVAATDTYGLYSTFMDVAGGYPGCNIKRDGWWGSYTYTVGNGSPTDVANWASRPVNIVSWGDAARFANWMHNGQPMGEQDLSTTEDGSYYLNGETSIQALVAVTRKANATWVIPTEDEWYKAAYHKNDGVTDNHWDYPTNSDSMPSHDLLNPDPGNNANFASDHTGTWHYTIDGPYYRTEVGEFENSDSPYGTFDQGGNVWEWNEAVIDGAFRGTRGGSFDNSHSYMIAWLRRADYLSYETSEVGFRVALVPEPATVGLLTLVSIVLFRRRQRPQG